MAPGDWSASKTCRSNNYKEGNKRIRKTVFGVFFWKADYTMKATRALGKHTHPKLSGKDNLQMNIILNQDF